VETGVDVGNFAHASRGDAGGVTVSAGSVEDGGGVALIAGEIGFGVAGVGVGAGSAGTFIGKHGDGSFPVFAWQPSRFHGPQFAGSIDSAVVAVGIGA